MTYPPNKDHNGGDPETSYPAVMGKDGALVCEMIGVREYGERHAVQLVRRPDNGRLVMRAVNEGGYSAVDIDLFDVLNWARGGPVNLEGQKNDDGTRTDTVRFDL